MTLNLKWKSKCAANLPNRLGMSLVELMVAVGIIMIIVVPLVGAVFNGIKGAVNFANANKALQTAQELMEEIKRKRWDEKLPLSGDIGDITPGPPYSVIGRDGGETNPFANGANAAKLTWDDIDDYNGLVEYPARDINNNIILGAERFTRSVSVRYVNVSPGTATEPPAAPVFNTVSAGSSNDPYKEITITVSWDGMSGAPVTISTILANTKKY